MDITQPDWLTKAMQAADVATGELAKRSGVSRSQIQRICNGMSPRLKTLVALQAALSPKSQKEEA